MFKDRKFLWLICSLAFVAIFEFLSLSGRNLPPHIAFPLFLSIIIAVGYQTILEGFRALITLNFKSINLLMLLAVIGAFYLGKYEEAAIVIVLYNLAEKLEDMGIERSKSSLSSLVDQMPKDVFIKGSEIAIPLSEVKVGDIVLIKPGEMIPLDGQVTFGSTAIDESPITGEPIPKDKMVGDSVFAGTLNKQGYIELRVDKLAKDSTVAKIEEITFKAHQSKAETQKFIEKFSAYYTPSVILLALLWTAIPPIFFDVPFQKNLADALTLLVIACPCALVISTPVSIYSAIGNAASKGILIKGGRYLEAIGNIQAIAIDKTRTLTFGNPIVTDIIPFGNTTKEHLLSCAAGIESQSEHPLAKSITQAAKNDSLTPHSIKNFQVKVGKGAKADCLVCDEMHHCIGKLEFILEEHAVPAEVREKIETLQKDGKTVIVVCTNKGVEGIIGLTDEIRPESSEIVEQIKQLNIHPVMLTGDNTSAAMAVAKVVGIKEVKANQLPQDKASAIEELLARYTSVAMIGDGINDAPALALSSVGITMSELGSDTAIDAASIIMLHEHLNRLPSLVKLGRKTIQIIKANTLLAISVKFVFISLALVGLSNLALAIFADVGITVLVILNSLRLARL
ncbi:MAG: cation-translocating P-type ATPase [Chlamydiales bacterium]|nr:cation-translocating P-type ATPase [Chlamydiales bacterium]